VTTEAHTESTEATTAAAPAGVILTDVAAVKVKSLIEQEGRDDLRLRIAVQPGGCSVCGTSCSSTSGRWTATSSPTSTGSRWWSTG
jgi:hypothetical protein